MFHLLDPHCIYIKEYVGNFIKKHGDPANSLMEWKNNPNKHKREEDGKYSIDSFASPFSQVFVILLRFHAYPNISVFLDD